MKRLILIPMLAMLTGCAYNETFIFAKDSTVFCSPSVDKPVDIVPSLDFKMRDAQVPLVP